MLEGMRSVQKTWVGRLFMAVIMGFIVVSFVFWGIGNVFTNYGVGKLARVGGVEITADAFRSSYQAVLQNLQARNGGKAISNEQARAAGVPGQVLEKLIGNAALDDAARKMRLGMSEEDIASAIRQDPEFKGADGKFEKARFDSAMRNIGFSEQGFVREQRNTYLRQEIAEAVGGAVTVPHVVLDALYRYGAETRAIAYIRLPVASAGDTPAPDDASLKAFYEARKQGFMAPEIRKLVTLAVTPNSLAKPDDVTDAEAQRRYDELRETRYGAPEKRALQHMVFANAEEAAAASARIKAGTTFDEIAAERKLTAADLDFGVKSKIQILDKPAADAAFALAQGGVSEPVKEALGVSLLRVNAITEAVSTPFSDVAASIKLELAAVKASPEVQAAHDKIEDLRTQGKPLGEAAKTAGFEVRVIDAIDAQGRDKSGTEVPGLVDRDALLRAAFASDVGVDNDTVSTKDRGYAWFEVQSIEPARQLTFEDVRDRVAQAWKIDETSKRLAAKGADMVKRLNAGEKLTALAEAEKLEVRTLGNIRRNAAEGLSEGERTQVFNLPTGGAGSYGGEDGSRLLFQVTASEAPPLDPADPQARRMREVLSTAMSQDLVTQYVQRLQGDAGVEINDATLRQLTGGDGG